MVRPLIPRVLLPLVAAACAGAPEQSLDVVADDLATRDVVFLGELRSSAAGHLLQEELLHLLHARRPDLVLSLEMFERDVQEHVDAWLAGTLDDAEFAEKARPWRTHDRFYRPLLEYARQHGLPVLAANLPAPVARRIARDGLDALEDRRWLPERVTVTRNAYWDAFRAAMGSHAGTGDEASMWRFYEAQCAKDDAMAETIARHLAEAEAAGGAPLVVHVTGQFHSDHGLGTVQRLRWRRPDLAIGIVRMEEVPPAIRCTSGAADWLLRVPEEPDRPASP